jgi:hypothetical protein
MPKLKPEHYIIILLWILVGVSFQMTYNYDFPFICGIIALTIATATIKKIPEVSFTILLLTLFLSIFSIIKCYYSFSFTFMRMELLNFFLFVILIIKRFSYILFIKEKCLGTSPDEIEKISDNRVAFFKREFKNLTLNALEQKLNQEVLTEEAKLAIKELIKEMK